MANNFCRFLSNGYRIKSNGTNLTYSPCCWFAREVDLLDNPKFDQEKQLITDITEWTPDCATCKRLEDSGAYGNSSPRLRSFSEIPDESLPNNVPAWMELTIDITCNAACIMCGPWHSTTWRKQEVKFGLVTKEALPPIVDPFKWLDIIKSKFPLTHLTRINFLGGEPFQSPITLEFLRLLKETRGSLSDVTVRFHTNGSITPSEEVMQLAAECKLIKFNLSIDGVGKRFEYQRYPLNWEKIQTNIQYVKNLKLDNLKFICVGTLTPLTVWYFDELEAWAKETFRDSELLALKPNTSAGDIIGLENTPPLLRLAVFKKFGTDHSVSKLFSGLRFASHKSCVQYLDNLDTHRKTNWRETFPDIVQFLE